jgi:hypothetical protein
VGCDYYLWGQNPDLGVPTPRPPVEERSAAPQTPLHKGGSVGSGARFALASQRESICEWGRSIVSPYPELAFTVGFSYKLLE